MAAHTTVGCRINANEALSGEFALGSFNQLAIEIPSEYTGSTTMTFQCKTGIDSKASINPVPERWRNVYDSTGTEVSVTVAANRIVGVVGNPAAALAPCSALRIRSGTSAAPVTLNPGVEINVLIKQY